MRSTSTRLLELLVLFQTRRDWPGKDLASRLDVTERTLRNDVERLRDLGYQVESVRGRGGYYRLAAGSTLPPLQLDDEEAVAVAISLRTGGDLAGIEESSARALAKLEQMLPPRLRPRVRAMARATTHGPENTDSNVEDPAVAADVLSRIADGIDRQESLRFGYRDADGPPTTVDPYRLVNWQRRWYLVARDKPTARWGTYRVDWMDLRMRTGLRFEPEPMAESEYADFVVRHVASTGWSVHARIRILAPAEEVLTRINPAVGVVEPVDEHTSVLVTGGDSHEVVAVWIGMLGLDFEVDSPPELVDHLRTLAARYTRAVP